MPQFHNNVLSQYDLYFGTLEAKISRLSENTCHSSLLAAVQAEGNKTFAVSVPNVVAGSRTFECSVPAAADGAVSNKLS